MTKIKLCGMMRHEDVEAANLCRPDYIGFIFWPESRRYVTRELAAELKRTLAPSIQAVGVFVDEDLAVVKDLFNQGIIDIAQLHGHETEEDVETLKAAGVPVIRTFRDINPQSLKKAEASHADYVLFDAGMGQGAVFDWKLIQGVKRPFFLAGGLHLGNVRGAIDMLNPYAVDVSSGVEPDGFKAPEKMREFIQRVR